MLGLHSSGHCRLGFLLAGCLLCVSTFYSIAGISHAAKADPGQSVMVPAQPYPVSGLRQRLIAEGKTIPGVDNSKQSDIPARYFPPKNFDPAQGRKHAAVVALPDCNDQFPENWIAILQDIGLGVLLISPYQAHPSQSYCTEGSLDKPKHGLTYWSFDALNALSYLAQQPDIDAKRIAVFGYGYGAAAAQFTIYRHGLAKRIPERFRALVGLRPQCMSEMDNFVPSLLVGVRNDPFNPPAWCEWRIDRDLGPNRKPVQFELVNSGETIEKQATREWLPVENSPAVVSLITNFLSDNEIEDKSDQN